MSMQSTAATAATLLLFKTFAGNANVDADENTHVASRFRAACRECLALLENRLLRYIATSLSGAVSLLTKHNACNLG
uniref:Putative secreted protein n=1 Tax=Ixodes ricinus TaxID=34613 RepID=A0A6B0U076_IXORI